jgi:hypothetical protein
MGIGKGFGKYLKSLRFGVSQVKPENPGASGIYSYGQEA